MLFSSLTFIFIFLPLIFVAFHLLQRFKHFVFAKVALIVASFIFYAYFKVEYIFILFGSILINFFIAQGLLKASKNPLWGGGPGVN